MNDVDVFSELAERWNPARSYLQRPVAWVKDVAKEHLVASQQAIINSVRDNRYTAAVACHDSGKSMVAARAIAWWISTHPPGEAFVVSTAPTAAQVSAILWRELAKVHSKAELIGRINRAGYPMWYLGNELIGYGRKPADYVESAFQGIHARYVLVVIDEAGGVSKSLFNSVDALVTNENARVLAIGNPDDAGSHFASICKPDSDWNVIQIDGLRTPNMTKESVIGFKSQGFGYKNPRYPLLWALMRSEKIPFSEEEIPLDVRPMLLSALWVEERIRRWAGVPANMVDQMLPNELEELVRRRCSASSLFQAKVRGIFPTTGNTGVIPLGWVQQAVNRWHDVMDKEGDNRATSLRASQPGRFVLGVDVARGGSDETAFAHRYGNIVEKITRYQLSDTMEVVDNAAAFMHEPGAISVVDVIGIGAGVYDRLRRMKAEGMIVGRAIAFNAAANSGVQDQIGEFKFRNDRAAAWWKMRELLDPSKGSQVCLPDDERLIEELVAVKYDHLVGGVIKIESKDEIRKRLGRSTDTADAVIQSFWVEGQVEQMLVQEYAQGANGSGVRQYTGYDPFTDYDLVATPGYGGSGSILAGANYGPYSGGNSWDL